MEGPGRPSAASLTVAPVAAWARIEPPQTLTEAQTAIWREIVATKPSEWFKADCAPVLEAYCKAITHYREMASRLDTPPEEFKDYRWLVEMVGKQARLMGELASKLRLTPQARYTAGSATTASKKVGAAAKPWSA
jgi:phage terminase small subunit